MDTDLQERLSRFISAYHLERFDDPAVIAESIQHLNSLYKALCSFLPLYIEDEILRAKPYSALRPGTFMFADVSGFTILSERLQRENTEEGAEILTMIMNDYFAEMLEILAKSDGQLIKFAGDALLAFFPARPRSISDVLKAVRTGLRMQRAIQRFKPIQDPRLTDLLKGDQYNLVMSIGIARGKLFEMLIGNSVQRDHLILGSLPGAAMHAESVGQQDEVIVDAKVAALLVGHFSVKRMEKGFSRVVDSLGGELGDYEFEALSKRRAKASALFDLTTDMLMNTLRQALTRVETMAAYVAPAVLQELVTSEDYHLRSSNRFTVTMFIHATGFAEMLRAWGEKEEHRELVAAITERYYSLIQRAITIRGGTLARTDPFRVGTKILATFGAPVAHYDDADRAVDAALEMQALLGDLNESLAQELPSELQRTPYITQRIGIAQGYSFASEVGWRSRREFTVMGDEVNLAARLMSTAADGQIIISDRVYERVKGAVEAEKLPPMRFKGRQHDVQIYAVLRVLDTVVDFSQAGQVPFVGNEHLLQVLSGALEQSAQESRAHRIALIAHNGAGKSRIARHIAQTARSMRYRVAWATCSRRDTHRTIMHSLIAQLLDIRADDDSSVLHQRLHDLQLLDLEEGLQELLLDEHSTAYCLTINAFATLVEQFFNAFALEYPTLLVIDDLHREHSVGLDILSKMLSSITRAQLVTLVLYEPPFAPDLNAEIHVIEDLNEDELVRLAMHHLGVPAIGERLKALLWNKTRGHPIYAEAYLDSLRSSGCIVEGELHPDAQTDLLPEGLREVVMSRVDALPIDAQSVLRSGAVLGNQFTSEALSAVSEIRDESRTRVVLRSLVDELLLMPIDGRSYVFRQELVCGAIYSSLGRSMRLKLHRSAANYWKTLPPTEYHHRRLAFHLTKCGLLPQAIEVLVDAGEEAERRGELESAVSIYGHALEIFPDEKGITARLERLRRRIG